MTGHALEDEADRLYEFGQDLELLQLAEASWSASADQLVDGVAEVSRLSRATSVRLMEAAASPDESVKYLVQKNLWESHGLTAAVLSGATHVVAGFLLPRFFDLCNIRAFEEARQVLDDMVRLIEDPRGRDDSAVQRPFAKVLWRLIHEKRGYCFYAEERFDDAADSYKKALNFTNPGSRGRFKVRGGLALATFCGSTHEKMQRDALTNELKDVANSAELAGYPDVFEWATRNLQQIADGRFDKGVPFELP